MKTLKEIFGGFKKPNSIFRKNEKNKPTSILTEKPTTVIPLNPPSFPVRPAMTSVIIKYSDVLDDLERAHDDAFVAKIEEYTNLAQLAWEDTFRELEDEGEDVVPFNLVKVMAMSKYAHIVRDELEQDAIDAGNVFNRYSTRLEEMLSGGKISTRRLLNHLDEKPDEKSDKSKSDKEIKPKKNTVKPTTKNTKSDK